MLEDRSYTKLKEQLIRRLLVSETAELKQLAGDKVGTKLLQSFWLQKLPESTLQI